MGENPVIYGWLTPRLNIELKQLLEHEVWPPEIVPSPEFAEVLVACDRAFLLEDLKRKCLEHMLSKRGHKKILCAKLLSVGDEEVTAIAQKVIQEQGVEA